MRIRSLTLGVIVPIATGAALGVAGVAAAAPDEPKSIWPNPNTDGTCDRNAGLCRTDNTTITYYAYTSLTSDARTRIDNMMTSVANNGVFSVTKESAPDLDGSTETDFIFRQDSSKMPSTNTIGITLCDDPVTTYTCDQTYMYFRSSGPDRPLICHESGHAVGLTHGNDSYPEVAAGTDLLACMQQPSSEYAGYNNWGAHNWSWIAYIY